jgi:hypothetical protein
MERNGGAAVWDADAAVRQPGNHRPDRAMATGHFENDRSRMNLGGQQVLCP